MDSNENNFNSSTAVENIRPDLNCMICYNVFVNATTLMCSHSFCLKCIRQWRLRQSACPICRVQIKGMAPCRALDNIVAAITNKANADADNYPTQNYLSERWNNLSMLETSLPLAGDEEDSLFIGPEFSDNEDEDENEYVEDDEENEDVEDEEESEDVEDEENESLEDEENEAIEDEEVNEGFEVEDVHSELLAEYPLGFIIGNDDWFGEEESQDEEYSSSINESDECDESLPVNVSATIFEMEHEQVEEEEENNPFVMTGEYDDDIESNDSDLWCNIYNSEWNTMSF